MVQIQDSQAEDRVKSRRPGAQPKVAFLMAVYDQERPEFLRQSIESMLGQSYPDVHIHIYKDGILGEDLERVFSDYRSRYSQIFVHAHPENRGLSICLNAMIGSLKNQYDYFARMDSDDTTTADRVEKQVAFLQSHPEIDIVGSFIKDMDEQGRELKQVKYPETHEEIYRFFRKRNPIAHTTVMYRRSYFEKAGLYPPVRLEDGLYWMQGLSAGCRFHNMPEYFVNVRRTDDFLKRRSGFKKAWEELQIKCSINRTLKYGVTSYVYAFAAFVIQLLPVPIKQFLYNHLR